MIDFNMIPSPCYVMEEKLLRRNLSLIKSVKEKAGVNIILAFKAFAMWKAFPIVREYIPCDVQFAHAVRTFLSDGEGRRKPGIVRPAHQSGIFGCRNGFV